MAEFQVHGAEDDEEAEEVWQGTRQWVEENRGKVTDKRIYSIRYYDGDDDTTHEVSIGDPVPHVGEPAVAIYESEAKDMHLICTPNRGVIRGMPVMVGNHDVRSVTEFDSGSY